jgi:hypothetical protein
MSARRRSMNARLGSLVLASALCSGTAGAAQPPVVLTTFGDGDIAAVLAHPDVGLPAPAQATAGGFGVATRPHGLAFLRAGEALVADFTLPQLARLRIADAGVHGVIELPTRTNANGTLAVSRDGNYALSFGESSVGIAESAVVTGFANGAISVHAGAPNLRVRRFVTAAIDFDASGRAYVCHTNGVAALDPPYTTALFDVALPTTTSTSVCRLSRDGQRLFVTRASAGIGIATAPFSAATVPAVVAAPAGVGALGAIGISPDGAAVLIAQSNPASAGATRARLFLLRAPFTAASTMQELALPAAISGNDCAPASGGTSQCPGFEDIDVSPDGRLAIVTGNSSVQDTGFAGRAPLLVITDPFVDATRTMHAVTIGSAGSADEGRGTGSARFEPADLRIFADGFER